MKQKFLPTIGLAAAFLLSIQIAQGQEKVQPPNREKSGLPKVISISALRGGDTDIEYTEGGRAHKARLQGSRIAELYVNDQKIPERDHASYEPTIKKILEQIEKDQRQMEKALTPPKAQPGTEKAVVEVNKLKKGAQKDPAQEAKDRALAEEERKRSARDREQKKN